LTAAITEFSGPYSMPVALTTGPGGDLWVLNSGDDGNSSLTVVAPDGTVQATYPIPTQDASAQSLTVGPDGNVWFVEQNTNIVGKVTPTGQVTEYPIPNAPNNVGVSDPNAPDGVQANPTSIVAGADGALWFNEPGANAIGRITTAGVITQIPTPGLQPNDLTVGPDKAIWFIDGMNNTIDRLNADDSVTTFPIPNDSAMPAGLTTGPDGALWFVDQMNNEIGRITTSGVVTEIPILADLTSPNALTFDSSGNIWVTGSDSGIVWMTPQGQTIAVGQQLAALNWADGVTIGPDGAVWFTDPGNDEIGRVDPSSVTALPTDHPLSGLAGQSGSTIWGGSLSVTGNVTTFFDGNPSGAASDFSAQINWGDGATSAGSVQSAGAGQFGVNGDHTYAQAGTYPVTVTINDVNPAHTPQPNTLTLSISAQVSDQPLTPIVPVIDPESGLILNTTASTTAFHPASGTKGSSSSSTPVKTKTPAPAPSKTKPVTTLPPVFNIRSNMAHFLAGIFRPPLVHLTTTTAPATKTTTPASKTTTTVTHTVVVPKTPAFVFPIHFQVPRPRPGKH
jgi:virginiamycin B lyase